MGKGNFKRLVKIDKNNNVIDHGPLNHIIAFDNGILKSDWVEVYVPEGMDLNPTVTIEGCRNIVEDGKIKENPDWINIKHRVNHILPRIQLQIELLDCNKTLDILKKEGLTELAEKLQIDINTKIDKLKKYQESVDTCDGFCLADKVIE